MIILDLSLEFGPWNLDLGTWIFLKSGIPTAHYTGTRKILLFLKC